MEIDLIRRFDDNDRVNAELVEQKKHEYHLVGRQKVHRGHILFSFNRVTGEVKQAEMQYCKDIDFVTLQPLYNPKVVIERDCVYLQALNSENLMKKLKRMGIV